MSAERSLFDDTMELADLVRHIERLADSKSVSYLSTYGISKNKAGVKKYSATLIFESPSKAIPPLLINADSFRQLFDHTKDFLHKL